MNLSKTTFQGYKRDNGRVGVRNHVLVLPVDDLSNAACEVVANTIKGTLAIPHPYGRLQFGADLELHFKTLIGTGSNPNVAATVVIGIEDGWAKRVADGIAAAGKPVSFFGIEGHGDLETIRRASKAAKDYMHWASELHREEWPLKDLWVSTKCGESDTTSGIGANPCVGNAFDKLYAHGETTELTGGEQLVAARCRTPAVRDKFMFMFNRYQDVIERHKTSDLMDSQPTKGNIAGGRGDGDLVRGKRLRGALLPDGAGQRHRQSHPARDQTLRQSAHGAPHVRAHRCRRVRHHAQGNQHGPGRRQAAGDDVPHCERPAHRRRSARTSRVRAHAPVRERLMNRLILPLMLCVCCRS